MVRFRVVAFSLTVGAWEAFLDRHPEAHLLQTPAWGELKARHGWRPLRIAADGAGAQLLMRRVLPGFDLAYIPRGPVGDWRPLLPEVIELARARGAFVLILEPDSSEAETPDLRDVGFVAAARTVQPRRSLIVDLRRSEEAILDGMHQKTRYNIRLAERRGVTVRPWDQPEAFAAMLRATGDRQGFGIHRPAYYRDAYDLFHPRQECELLVAEVNGDPVAALMVFARGSGSWYLYGASTERARSSMPTYALQWQAMRWARQRGAAWYDLWGVPDEPGETLESEFETRRDGLWGVYRFKRGFGGRLVRAPGGWEYPLRPSLFRLYRRLGSRRAG
jgi:peptidoglycan pentaglycine glycine transferase (the first glycine)